MLLLKCPPSLPSLHRAGSYIGSALLSASAWTVSTLHHRQSPQSLPRSHTTLLKAIETHGQKGCFLPLKQNMQDDYAPRVFPIVGYYPECLEREFYFTELSSEPAPGPGQWTLQHVEKDDPNDGQFGTVAMQGNEQIHQLEDPVVIIAEHTAFGIQLPEAIDYPVNVIVLVDRAQTGFAERKFVVVEMPSEEIKIAAFPTKADLPESAEILGRVIMVQIPWLPGMSPTKTGFAEADEYFTA